VIAAVLGALKGLGLLQWLWSNRAWLKWAALGLVFAALAALWRWERHDRIAAEAAERAAVVERDLATADAARWRQASDLRDQAIARRDAAIAQQDAAIERWRASAERAEAAQVAAEAQSRAARAAFDARRKELDDEARAKPQDVRDLGPLVRGRADRLFD
jgi:hypothetical protein